MEEKINLNYTEEEKVQIKNKISEVIDSVSSKNDIPYVNTLKERIQMRNKFMKEGKSYEEIETLVYERYKFKRNNFYHLVKDVRLTLFYLLYKLDLIILIYSVLFILKVGKINALIMQFLIL